MIDAGRVEWMLRNVVDVEGSNTGLEEIGKHLKRQKGEGVETVNIAMRRRRAAMTVEQRRLERTRNVQVNMPQPSPQRPCNREVPSFNDPTIRSERCVNFTTACRV